MNHTITNGILTVTSSTLGAELQSIIDEDGSERLWQGDEGSWKSRATNIFPWVARLWEGKYTYLGKTYQMASHGFTRTMEFECEKGESCLTFTLNSSPETLSQYPFEFTLEISYLLKGRDIIQTFTVTNKGKEKMYYGVGGHPGFIVPMEAGKRFEDYCLVFSEKKNASEVKMSPDCFVLDEYAPYPLENGDTIRLKQELFKNDAIILKDMADSVNLCSDGKKKIRLDYKGFDYLGLWNWPTKDVEYLCIEPWTALPGRKNKIEDIEEKPELSSLEPGEKAAHTFTIGL